MWELFPSLSLFLYFFLRLFWSGSFPFFVIWWGSSFCFLVFLWYFIPQVVSLVVPGSIPLPLRVPWPFLCWVFFGNTSCFPVISSDPFVIIFRLDFPLFQPSQEKSFCWLVAGDISRASIVGRRSVRRELFPDLCPKDQRSLKMFNSFFADFSADISRYRYLFFPFDHDYTSRCVFQYVGKSCFSPPTYLDGRFLLEGMTSTGETLRRLSFFVLCVCTWFGLRFILLLNCESSAVGFNRLSAY